jgi:hypothetical protein
VRRAFRRQIDPLLQPIGDLIDTPFETCDDLFEIGLGDKIGRT